MEALVQYKNGNTLVSILEDGTKIRQFDGVPVISHPESIDVKITNYCDHRCMYCHEMSTTKGKHCDIDALLRVLSPLPSGVEIAIGGGNPLSHPRLEELLISLKRQGLIANITVNQDHLAFNFGFIKWLVRQGYINGIGISVVNDRFKYIGKLQELTPNVVFHLIAGVNNISVIDELLLMEYTKVLVLGYKVFGFGVNYLSDSVKSNVKEWKNKLPSYIRKCTMSFDNLAIDQLNIRRLLTKEGWNKFYMGDDFCFTMYIDAVEQMYAPTSRSNNRISFNVMSLIDYFNSKP